MNVETARVEITNEQGLKTGFTVPAYTRNETDLLETIDKWQKDYFRLSNPNGMSLADYAFFLLAKAAGEPTTLEDSDEVSNS